MNTYSQTLYKVKKTKSGSDEISQGQYRGYPSKCSLGQLVQTKVEKKNERDEFLAFSERKLERWQGVMQKIMALTDEVQEVGGSTRQELYDRKISW